MPEYENENLLMRTVFICVVVFGIPASWMFVDRLTFGRYASQKKQAEEQLIELRDRIQSHRSGLPWPQGNYAVEPAKAEEIARKHDLIDPFTGKPYMYKKKDQFTYYIYSFGPNKEDEDGGGDDILKETFQ